MCFVLSAFKDNLFIVHYSKTFMISSLAISNRYFMLLCEEKNLSHWQTLSDEAYLLHVIDRSQKSGEEQILVLTLVVHRI